MRQETARWAIQDLIMTYAALVDAGDFAGVGELFRDGTLHSGGDRTGSQEVADWYRAILIVHPDGTPRTRHVTTNVRVTVEGDAASAHSYFTVFQGTETLALQPIAAGYYDDRFVVREGEWRFAERTPVVTHAGDVSQHLRTEVIRAAG